MLSTIVPALELTYLPSIYSLYSFTIFSLLDLKSNYILENFTVYKSAKNAKFWLKFDYFL